MIILVVLYATLLQKRFPELTLGQAILTFPTMEPFLSTVTHNPLVAFTILLLVILTIPPLFERLRLPGLVGLLFAGVVLGQDGLGLLSHDSESIKLLSDIGKIYLMFVAGLEIDLVEFRKTRNRSLAFGLATFAVPMAMGIAVGQAFGFGWNPAVLIGSLLASHTLLGYPIVQRLGVVRSEAVMVTIGATIFTDIAALLVLAVCVAIHAGEFSLGSLVVQLVLLGLYSVVVLVGFDWAGKEYFRRTGDEQSNQFLFILLAVFLAAVGAQVINIEQIVGAFLAGLAVNDVVGEGPVKEKVEFVGSTLFIPFFFVGMGLLLDVPAFIQTLQFNLPLVLGIVGGLILSKFLAAAIIKQCFRYNWIEGLTMWSLSLPQVAATLAAAVAAYQAQNALGVRLINANVLNSVIVLMLVTSILGPLLTARFAPKLASQTALAKAPDLQEPASTNDWITPPDRPQSALSTFRVIVPLSNPDTQQYLLAMGAMLARYESGVMVPLAIAKAHVHMDDPQLNNRLQQSQHLLQQAEALGQDLQVATQPAIRIDDDVALGISRAARENDAQLIVMGWSESTTGLRAKLFGSVIDGVFWSAHCPVAVMRLLDNPTQFRRILLPLKNIAPQSLKILQFAQLLAKANQATLTVLHVCDRHTSSEQTAAFKTALTDLLATSPFSLPCQIKIVVHEDAAKVILRLAKAFDLIILRSFRRRTAGGVTMSDLTEQVLHQLQCSVVIFGEPLVHRLVDKA